ncbi:MAG: hypothetical protein UY48_C0003G0081 [Candidatus Gottesmanbacteria bacterium GW2011_GWB1_49_7]|uniref:Uncharacterized protein n=1 Tax=Candidatus Gottesmanbacteria bacterium GW2011_GWB1_49_7 TaxID=1618448 RepID=A0A0G1Z3A8_9BACT|nr:MAG: hypothetical protein UY48_C0003G0081 [Candidatus Gottesmanbacteria bacterium GW2011_GWB1_49_7]
MDDLVVSKLDTLLAQVADLSEYLKTHLGDKRSIRPVPRLAVRLSPEQVRAARTVLQMDQQSFAEVLGIHHASTVSRWERRNGACKINKVYSNTILTLVREKLTEEDLPTGASDKAVVDYLESVLVDYKGDD